MDILGEVPENPGLAAVQFAASPEEIINWFENPDTTPPILLATDLFGPDLIARVRVSNEPTNMEVIVMGKAKPYTSGNKESLSAEKALNSLNKDH